MHRRWSATYSSASARALGVALSLGVFAGALRGALQDESEAPKGFALPETRQSRAIAERAREHADAQRWSEALAALQELIEHHGGEVLRAPGAAEEDPVRQGAADWARGELARLPSEARTLYATRYGVEAKDSAQRAQRARDRRALLEVARRFPLTDGAYDAWWSLGDLELELGHVDSARDAFSRAEELGRALGKGELEKAAQRMEWLQRLELDAPQLVSALPGPDCVQWTQSFARAEETPFSAGAWNNLYPCVHEDRVLVSDSLKLWAFDAWSGDPRWASGEPEGWSAVDSGEYRPDGRRALRRRDFFTSLEPRSLMVRPAAAAGVALAALQVPFTRVYNDQFQQYSITSVIPERRLYAFDLHSGRELWNHRPPLDWDGESGSFEQVMSVAAPPVIAGSRVLVPAYRMQGRVDLHMGCFDLFSGERLWSTAVASGQIALNMFGRQYREYCAAPVTVVGDKVLLITQLGALAALDLYSGDLLWESVYTQIPVPRATHYEQREREQVWGVCAPVVVGEVVITTPTDSFDMTAFDLGTGRKLWARASSSFRRPARELLTMLGADESRVWIAGARVVSARVPLGFASGRAPTELSESPDITAFERSPRPLLTEHHVLVATNLERRALDRDALRNRDARASGEWRDGTRAPGNVAAVDGATFFAAPGMLSACIDWRVVEERQRARAAERPDDPEIALEWATILERRGLVELEAARLDAALEVFAQAREKLARFAQPRDDAAPSAQSQRMFSLYMSEARAYEVAADPKLALERLERALALAPNAAEATRALVRRIDLLEIEGAQAARSAALAELGQRGFDQLMPDEWWSRRGRALYQASLPPDGLLARMPVSLFVEIESSLDARRAADAARELEYLHAILASWGDVQLPGESGPSASSRIAELASSAPEAYAAFERLASEALERALAARDAKALERLPALFPHSRAAVRASKMRLEAALAERDFARVVASVQSAVPDDWSIESARESEVQALLVLRAALLEIGNLELARDLTRRLALHHADTPSALARDGGATIAALVLPSQPERAPRVLSEASDLDSSATDVRSISGASVLLGAFDAPSNDDPSRMLQIVCQKGLRNDVVQAYDPRRPFQPEWSQPLEQSAVQPGWKARQCGSTLVVAGRNSLAGLALESGILEWRWSSPSARLESFQATAGLVVATTRTADGRATLVALEARGGVELWARALPPGVWAKPVLGRDHVVVLPSDWAASPALVLDPCTGSRTLSIPLSAHVGESDAAAAWIEEQRLILPSFPKSSSAAERDCLVAYDLASGQRAWRVPCEPEREFDSIVSCGADVFLVYLATGRTQAGGALVQLNTRIGAVRRLQNVVLDPEDVLIGVPRQGSVELPGPFLFLRSPSKDGLSTSIEAVQLPYGKSWTHKLAVPSAQFYNSGPMPLPALSQSTAVLAYTETPRTRGQVNMPRTTLLMLDRDNGFARVTEGLPAELGTADTLEFATLGSTLWIAGNGAQQVRTRP